MTDTELEALEAKAKAATPGPWYAYTDGSIVWEKTHEIHTAVCDSGEKNKNNAAFIAAANPAAVLELIAELRQVRRERDWLASQLEGACYSAEDAEYCSLHDCNDCKYTSAKVWLEAAKEAVK